MRDQLDLRPSSPAAGRPALREPIGVLGAGLHVPPRVVTNAELVQTLDTTEEWIESRFGVRERHFLDLDCTTSDMCVDAAEQALASAGLTAADIDVILVATLTPDQPTPSTAITVADRIGAHRAVPIDLNQATCASGVLSLLVAAQMLQSDLLRTALVIGADAMSRVTDPLDRTNRVLFGDAAAAVVMGRVPPGYGLLSWDIGSSLNHDVGIRAGGARRPASAETVAAREHFVHMNGKSAWQMATTELPKTMQAAAATAGVRLEDISYFAFHQANLRMLEAVMDDVGVPLERAGLTVDVLGNTCSASTLTAIHRGFADSRLTRDDLMLVAGIGSGALWGALCFRAV